LAFTRETRTFTLRLRDELRLLIKRGGLAPGDRLPSEAELAERYGVSRPTIRESLKLLEQDGLIEVKHGSGRFVSPVANLLVDRPVTTYESVSEMLGSLGYDPETRVVDARIVPASADAAAALGVDERDDIVQLERIREDGEVLIYSINAFSTALLDGDDPDPDDFAGSLNDWLAARGHAPHSSAAQLRAVDLPRDAEEHHELKGLGPWFLVTERCVDSDGAPVLYSRDYHRGDLFTFNVLRRPTT
jgi:GntR family transcriptional regulator